jgi:hypothetical protein
VFARFDAMMRLGRLIVNADPPRGHIEPGKARVGAGADAFSQLPFVR